MQYLSSRNMSSIPTTKIHKDTTPWMQSNNNTEYYNNDSSDADVYMSDTSKSHRSRNSTTDMCVEKNTEGKPPYSYATLIKYAIERSSENKLTLSQIYQWVIDHYPYYGSAGSGWKNSIRHNLSLNKSFVRVPRPVNEPGKGSYWTVDQYAIDTEQRVRTNVRGRSNRSSSDPSLHHRTSNDPWLLVNRNYRDGRSQSTDAGVTSSSSSAAALRRTAQYGYCSHPYSGYNQQQQQQQQQQYNNYPNNYYQARQQQQQQHSSVTYSLPNSYNNYPSAAQQPFYSHRQSCPDLTSTYSETSILPNFNTAGNEVCLESPSASSMCDNKMIYTTPFYSTTPKLFTSAKGRSFFKDPSNTTNTPGLPSPVLSPSNCSSTSSQHLSVADPLAMVTQHPSPVTTTTTVASKVTTPGNRLTSPYYNGIQRSLSSTNSIEEPSSPLLMMNSPINDRTRSPVPFCIDTSSAVAYIDMVSQHQQQQQNASPESSCSSSQNEGCSPQPSTTNSTDYQYTAAATNSFLHQNTTDERFDYTNL